MNASTKKSAVVAAGMAVCLASNVGVAVATEAPAPNVEKPEAAQEAQAAVATSDIQSEEQVEGTFAFDQTTITPNEHIAKFFRVPSDVVCREGVPYEGLGADFRIAVGGDVAQPFAASLEEMSREVGSHRQIMGCS